MAESLRVLISDTPAGWVHQAPNGALTFFYDEDYNGVPLSFSMPVSNRRFGDKMLRPFLFGLLPDNAEVRRSLGREYGVSGNNPFALLAHIGLDCPGAVQFYSGAATRILKEHLQKETLVPMTTHDIAKRLAAGRMNADARWEAEKEHWSLGGQQSKFALRYEDDAWYSCEGAAATTHIFKPGIPDLHYEALNEFICLKVARKCGIPAAQVDYRAFEDEPAIVVSRYDRVRDANGRVRRLHQEDFCQILGVLPERKYASEGGPNANDMLEVCKQTGDAASRNIATFLDMLMFNYLIAAPDGHAKNYSLLLDRDVAYLAPLYDVASMLPYTQRPFSIKTAMGIAGENRVGHISSQRLARFVQMNELEEFDMNGAKLAERLAFMASEIPGALANVLADHSKLPGINELGTRLHEGITEVCSRAIARLG